MRSLEMLDCFHLNLGKQPVIVKDKLKDPILTGKLEDLFMFPILQPSKLSRVMGQSNI